jgi:predicted RNase H-like HicB family nuclease
MVEYLIVAFPHPSCGWVAVLPDFVGVTGRGAHVEEAIERAISGAQDVCIALASINKPLPRPGELAHAKRNQRWAKEYGIDWTQALVRAASIPHPSTLPRRRSAKRESKVVAWSRRMAERENRAATVDYPPAAAE